MQEKSGPPVAASGLNGDSWSFCLLQPLWPTTPQGGLLQTKFTTTTWMPRKFAVLRSNTSTGTPPNNNYYRCPPLLSHFICPPSVTLNLILKKDLCSIQFIVPLAFRSNHKLMLKPYAIQIPGIFIIESIKIPEYRFCKKIF